MEIHKEKNIPQGLCMEWKSRGENTELKVSLDLRRTKAENLNKHDSPEKFQENKRVLGRILRDQCYREKSDQTAKKAHEGIRFTNKKVTVNLSTEASLEG